MKETLEFWGVVLNFAGGVVLSVDAVFARKHKEQEEGTGPVAEDVEKSGVPVRDAKGKRLTAERLRDAIAARSQLLGRVGFIVMSTGFLFDIVSKSSFMLDIISKW